MSVSDRRSAMFKPLVARLIVASFALSALIFSKPAPAQDRAGTVHRVVKDSKCAPVAAAFVKLKNAERHLTFMVVSQAHGRYSVSSLPAGQYIVQAIGGEFQSELSAPVAV